MKFRIFDVIKFLCKAASFGDFSCGLETLTMDTNKQVANRKGTRINLAAV